MRLTINITIKKGTFLNENGRKGNYARAKKKIAKNIYTDKINLPSPTLHFRVSYFDIGRFHLFRYTRITFKMHNSCYTQVQTKKALIVKASKNTIRIKYLKRDRNWTRVQHEHAAKKNDG